jgi:hypothetical protein
MAISRSIPLFVRNRDSELLANKLGTSAQVQEKLQISYERIGPTSHGTPFTFRSDRSAARFVASSRGY